MQAASATRDRGSRGTASAVLSIVPSGKQATLLLDLSSRTAFKSSVVHGEAPSRGSVGREGPFSAFRYEISIGIERLLQRAGSCYSWSPLSPDPGGRALPFASAPAS